MSWLDAAMVVLGAGGLLELSQRDHRVRDWVEAKQLAGEHGFWVRVLSCRFCSSYWAGILAVLLWLSWVGRAVLGVLAAAYAVNLIHRGMERPHAEQDRRDPVAGEDEGV